MILIFLGCVTETKEYIKPTDTELVYNIIIIHIKHLRCRVEEMLATIAATKTMTVLLKLYCLIIV